MVQGLWILLVVTKKRRRRKRTEHSELMLKGLKISRCAQLEQNTSLCLHSPTERPPCVPQSDRDVDVMSLDSQTSRRRNGGSLLPGTYDIILCVDFIETTG